MNSEYSVKVLRSFAEVEALRPMWESWHGHRDSDIDFFSDVAKSNPQTLRPHVIVVCYCDRPEAILIGRIDVTQLWLRIGYWQVPTPQVSLLTFVIGAHRGNGSPFTTELLFREVLNSLKRGEAQAARLDYIRSGSALHRLVTSMPSFLGRDYGVAATPHWLMDLPSTYEGILRSLSGDLRNQLKRKAKRLVAAFPDALVRCFEKPEELEILLRDTEAIASHSYQRGLKVGFLDTQTTRTVLGSQMGKNRYLGYVLYLKGRPSAFWLGGCLDSVFYSDYLAFDPEYSEYSPGIYLQTRVLEDLVRREASKIDFGPGDARYKAQFGTVCHEEMTQYVFPPTLKGTTLNTLRLATTFGNKAAKRIVQSLGVLPSLKRAVRDAKKPPPKSTPPALHVSVRDS